MNTKFMGTGENKLLLTCHNFGNWVAEIMQDSHKFDI